MSNPTTEVTLSASDTACAIAAAESYLTRQLRDYDEPAGGDEYDSWDECRLVLDDESDLEAVEETRILVGCTVSAEDGRGEMFFVTVELDREFKAIKHDLDNAINQACVDASADAYTRRAEAGYPDA